MSPWPRSLPLRIAAALWSGLYGVVGLFGYAIFALLGWVRWDLCGWHDGALDVVCRGPYARWMVSRHWGGFTLGWSIFYWDEDQASSQRCRVHERTHVGQVLRWGVLFPFAYAVGMLVGGSYKSNPFEVAAYKAGDAVPE